MNKKKGYTATHDWVKKHKGQPDTCEGCGKSGFVSSKIHWANVDHKYNRVLNDYIRLCGKCHYTYDVNKGLRKNNLGVYLGRGGYLTAEQIKELTK